MKEVLPSVFLLISASFAGGMAAQAQTNYEPYFFGTLAGTSSGGSNDGPANLARFGGPTGMALDNSGNLYVVDTWSFTIRKITSAGLVSTFAGSPRSPGIADGAGNAARFRNPNDIAFDSAGNSYISDTENHTIRKISPAGVVTTFAGLADRIGDDDGVGSAARFWYPWAVAVDSTDNVYVADRVNNTIRKITPGGMVSTFAGVAREHGSADGVGNAARFSNPTGVACDGADNLYVVDNVNHTIRKITPAALVTTFAGLAGNAGSVDGTGNAARFNYPEGVTVGNDGNLYVTDNRTIRKITPAGVVTTFAGAAGQYGDADGVGSAARFYSPARLVMQGNGDLYVSDSFNNTIRKITPAAEVATPFGVPPFFGGSREGIGSAARFNDPYGVTVDDKGNTYVAERGNHTIRKITPASVVTTLAGSAGNRGSDDGLGSNARFNEPFGVGVDRSGNVYVADTSNHTIRKISPAGAVTTLAGLAGNCGSTDGAGSNARFCYPLGVAVDSFDILYVADKSNGAIRKITPAGVVTTFATDIMANGVAVDSVGNLYVTNQNLTILRISSAGVVTTLAGSPYQSGTADGVGADARFYQPTGVAVDNAGNVYVTETVNFYGFGPETVRKITPAGVVTTIGGFVAVRDYADGSGPTAHFSNPVGIAVDRSDNLYVADARNDAIRIGGPAMRLIGGASAKTHGAAGRFDVFLPLSGTPGVECRRSGGNHTIVFAFNTSMVSGDVSVMSGAASIVGNAVFDSNLMTVNLSGVPDAQRITLAFSSVTDHSSQVLPNATLSVNMLMGDTDGNRKVNASDVSRTRAQSGAVVDETNFREDVTVNGAISASDVLQVKANVGHGLP